MSTTRAATLLVCLAHGRVCRVVLKEKTRYRQVWRTPMEECSSLCGARGPRIHGPLLRGRAP